MQRIPLLGIGFGDYVHGLADVRVLETRWKKEHAMAVLDLIRSARTGRGSLARATALLGAVWSVWADRRADAATRRALTKLSDHQLDDIGLVRSDIQRPDLRLIP
jgi:uncharacterized protein YjiS (DUF1127 family)